MTDDVPQFFVVTGGPGAGKTTLIEALAGDGIAVSGESGRAVIRAQQAAGGTALPWRDRLAFAEAMLARDVAAYEALRTAAPPVVFDRGIPDVVGYLRLKGIAVPEPMRKAARGHRYQPRIFVCPPWPDIYTTDDERRQSPELARRTCETMIEIYAALGYTLIEVPRRPVDARVRFVREMIGR